MTWNKIYGLDKMPSFKQIKEYVNNSYLDELCSFIEKTYSVDQSIEYSCCSLMPGWNIKYKKKGKSICTIYPAEGKFCSMVTISGKNQAEIEFMLPSCDNYVQDIYKNTKPFNSSRWLMIEVTSERILDDVKTFIDVKMKKI